MRRLSLLTLLLPAAGLASGCFVVVDPNPPVCNPPTQTRSQASYEQFRVRPGSFAEIPAADFGFSVTANNTGGYRVAYSDQSGRRSTCFGGILSTAGTFDASQTKIFGNPQITNSASNEIRFGSAPGADVDGLDVVPSEDPLFLDAFVNGSAGGVRIFFPDNTAGGALAVVASTNRGAFDSR
jgi:hypothetical protein